MARVPTIDRLDHYERQLDRVIQFVPYLALVVSLGLTLTLAPYIGPVPVPTVLALSTVAAAWMLVMVTAHPEWAERRGLMTVYYTGLLLLIGALIVCTPLFGFFAFTGYLHAVYALRGRARLVGVVLTALLSSLSQVGGLPTLTSVPGLSAYAVVVVFNVAVAGVMSFLAWVTTEQAERRKQMIVELGQANDRVAATTAENAGLHAQLLLQAREAGKLDERQRMAGEIHDTLAQGLTGIVTQLEAAEQADWQRHVRAAARLARDSLTEARRSVQALRPEPLDRAPLPVALAEVVRRWSAVSGIPAELVTTGTAQPLVPEIEAALLRTAQESLANVAKHASAGRVALTLSYMEDLVTLDVRDDGVGFDPTVVPARPADGGGFGLTAMRERVLRVAGTLELESEPGAGTAISACVPAIGASS